MLVISDIYEKMCVIGIPEVDDSESKMNIHPMVGSTSCSLAEECKRLCDDEVIIMLSPVPNLRRGINKNAKK